MIPSPCYVLEEEKLINNLEILQKVQQEAQVQIILALKGFAFFKAFNTVKEYLSATTSSSLHEARLAVEEWGERTHLCAPVYKQSEFAQLMEYSSHITFNSLNQWQQFKAQIAEHPRKIQCGLRINPEYSEVETAIYNPCIAGSRLGLRRKDLEETLPNGISGLHFHALCGNNSYTLENTLNAVEEKFGDLLQQATWLNMGGGHLITEKNYDVDHLIQILKAFKVKYNLEIILEPGGAVGWQTGFLLATILDIFDSDGITAIIMDASVCNHMPDCIEMPYTPDIVGVRLAKEGEKAYRIGGPTCLAGDFVGDYFFEREPQIGDQLIFEDMMHYTMVKNNTFNGVNLPSIGIIKKDQTFELVKSFGYEDYRSRLS